MLGPRMDLKARPLPEAIYSLTLVMLVGMACSNSGSNPSDPLIGKTEEATFTTPTKKVVASEWPALTDDLDFEELRVALLRQLGRFNKKSLEGTIQMGDDTYPLTQMKSSLEKFLIFTEATKNCLNKADKKSERGTCYKNFQQQMLTHFDLFEPDLRPGDPRYGETRNTFFTAYYTPLIYASTRYETNFRYPIYTRPSDSALAKSTRQEIDFQGKLANKNLEPVSYTHLTLPTNREV